MRPERVIYYNQFTGLTELCTSKDVEKGRCLNLPFGRYLTEDVTKNLILTGESNLSVHAKSFNINAFISGEFSNEGSSVLKKQFHFEIVDRDAASLLIKMTVRSNFDGNEKFEEKEFGKIEFRRSKDIKFNNCIGDALIRIFDFAAWNSDYESEKSLSEFALFVGLYIFVDLDGDWETLSNHGNFVDKKTDEQTKVIKQYIEDAKSSIITESGKILDLQHEIKYEQDKILEEQEKHHTETTRKLNEISLDIDAIKENLSKISNSLIVYKDDLKMQLDKCYDESEVEKIIDEFSERSTNKIIAAMAANSSTKDYSLVKNELLAVFGECEWNKLSDKTKDFLITSKLLFAQMSQYNQNLDYSGVCILVTKALEVELKRRFYYDFIDYLKKHYHDDYSQWHHSLYTTRRIGKNNNSISVVLEEKDYTLGSIAYTCCVYKPKTVSDEQFAVSQKRVVEYVETELLVNSKSTSTRTILQEIGRKVNHIKDRYRNPAAHTNYIKRIDAEQCINEIIDVQKVMLNIIKLFKA